MTGMPGFGTNMYMCPQNAIYMSSNCIYVSSNCYLCVLKLLYMCPYAAILQGELVMPLLCCPMSELKHVIALTKPLFTGEASDDAATPQRTCILAQVEQNRFSIKALLRLY